MHLTYIYDMLAFSQHNFHYCLVFLTNVDVRKDGTFFVFGNVQFILVCLKKPASQFPCPLLIIKKNIFLWIYESKVDQTHECIENYRESFSFACRVGSCCWVCGWFIWNCEQNTGRYLMGDCLVVFEFWIFMQWAFLTASFWSALVLCEGKRLLIFLFLFFSPW